MNRSLPLLLVGALGCAQAGVGVVVPIATLGRATESAHSTFCGGASSDSTVYDTTQVTERPILYKAQPLKYPARARARGAEGRVLLAVTINADGRPDLQSIQPISSPDSELTDAAVRWVRTAKFEPVCRATEAVRVRVAIPVDFKRGL